MSRPSKTRLKPQHLLILTLMLSCLALRSGLVQAEDEASSKMAAADNALQQALDAIVEAEQAGGNASELATRLNSAAVLLAQAEIAYRTGNLTEAGTKADSALSLANAVKDEALDLKNSSQSEARRILTFTAGMSFVGAVVFAFVLLFAWIRFKRSYAKKLPYMRPEVASNAEA
jgi:hypothetical protein